MPVGATHAHQHNKRHQRHGDGRICSEESRSAGKLELLDVEYRLFVASVSGTTLGAF